MERYAFKMRLNPGMRAEYIKRHDEIWPELVSLLREAGVTVLLSSHILAEVQQVCHSVSIIGDGRLISTGSVTDLVGDSTLAVARVWVEDSSAAIRALERARYRVVRNGDHLDVEGFEHRARLEHEPGDAHRGTDSLRARTAIRDGPRIRAIRDDRRPVSRPLVRRGGRAPAVGGGWYSTTSSARGAGRNAIVIILPCERCVACAACAPMSDCRCAACGWSAFLPSTVSTSRIVRSSASISPTKERSIFSASSGKRWR